MAASQQRGMIMSTTMELPLALLFISFLCVSGAVQESPELLTLISPDSVSDHHLPLAVSLPSQHLNDVASTVLAAEAWLRTHVLSHYPVSGVNHIAVGHNVLCVKSHQDQFQLVLPSIKNLFHSLTRWGLEREIKLCISISSQCLELEPHSSSYREDMAESLLKPLLEFIQSTNSSYLVNPSQPLSQIPDELHGLVSPHLQSVRKLGSFETNHIGVILNDQNQAKPTSRKLASFGARVVDPYPARPTPLPKLSPSSPVHVSFPANVARSPLPPLIGSSFPPFYFPQPPSSLPFAPKESPVVHPSPPPFGGFHLPPCNPNPTPVGGVGAPAPEPGVLGGEKLWCVAKPSVPADALQEAINFACGEGGGDCAEIQPDGSCYRPDTVVAHASYAFNSYWQKAKRDGGTCSFDGTAMIINSDPSFLNCRFVVS